MLPLSGALAVSLLEGLGAGPHTLLDYNVNVRLIGDFRRAFAYMENWPITVTQAPAGSEAEFASDIVLRFKASERGAAAVLNPRFVVKNEG